MARARHWRLVLSGLDRIGGDVVLFRSVPVLANPYGQGKLSPGKRDPLGKLAVRSAIIPVMA
jgi:hypothetical protein